MLDINKSHIRCVKRVNNLLGVVFSFCPGDDMSALLKEIEHTFPKEANTIKRKWLLVKLFTNNTTVWVESCIFLHNA